MTMVADDTTRNKLQDHIEAQKGSGGAFEDDPDVVDTAGSFVGQFNGLANEEFDYHAPREEQTKAMQDNLKKKFCPGQNENAGQNLDGALAKASSEALPDAAANAAPFAASLNNLRINRGLTGLV